MEDSLEDYIKIVRNTKNVRKEEPQKKISDKELITLQRKKQCEANAVKIVEFLIEGQLRPEVFLRCLKHINQDYYQDVVEERAISKLCGYSLCGKQIPEMPKKQYFISTKSNKVYDVTDRKNYCSNLCYKASIHIKQQIDTSPLWLRKSEDNIQFNLLPSTEKGSPGEEIDQGVARIPKDYEFTSVSSFTQISLSEIDEMEVKNKKSNKPKKMGVLDMLPETEEENDTLDKDVINADTAQSSSHNDKPSSSTNNNNNQSISVENSQIAEAPSMSSNVNDIKNKEPKIHKQNDIKPKLPIKSNKPKKSNDAPVNVLENIKKYVHEWITLETYIFLYGEDKVKETLDETQFQEYFKTIKDNENALAHQKKYLEICQKLHFTQLAEDKFDNSIIEKKIKPVPNYAKLKEESKTMDLKIRSFYSGVPYETELVIKTKDEPIPEPTQENVEEGPPAVLPLVETTSQTAIRRRIYLSSLEKAVVNLTQHLGISSHYIMKDIQSLVKTFKLQAHNIVFKPAIWSLIALILIKMLSIRDNNLSKELDAKQAQIFITAMLHRFANAEVFMSELLESLKDINLFLKQYFLEGDNIKK